MEEKDRIIKGIVYGDIIAAPFRWSGTSNRYFDLGQSRNAYYKGRAYTFHPQAGEASFASYAVSRWLARSHDDLTEEGLREEIAKILESHPRAEWTSGTKDSILSPQEGRSLTPDWAPLTRVSPIAEYYREESLERMQQVVSLCVGSTCRNTEILKAAGAIAEAMWHALRGEPLEKIKEQLAAAYGFDFSREREDLSELLQGKIPEPLEMIGVPTGAFRYVSPKDHHEPSAMIVAEAALRCVFDSDGWEDAVRRAVALQGPVTATASIAGAFALSAGMDITPSVQGKLSAMIPLEIERLFSDTHPGRIRIKTNDSKSTENGNDIVEVIFTGFGPSSHTAYVVPEGRDDIMTALRLKFADKIHGVTILRPEEVSGYMKDRSADRDETTHVIRPEPKLGFLYLQNGKLVSASEYVAPGMPPLQVRKNHRDAYRSLLSYTLSVQRQLNEYAGYHGEGQVHYEHAYHPVISRNRIDFYQGNLFAGAVHLDGRGLLKVIHGDLHDIDNNADASEYKNAEWCRRTIFSRYDAMDPVERIQNMKESIGRFILDEGVGTERFLDRGNGSDDYRIDYRKDDEDQLDKISSSDIPNLDTAAEDVEASEDPQIKASTKIKTSSAGPIIKETSRPSISFSTTADSGYAQRTRDNAAASEITLAIAVDFSTRGETLTAQYAGCRNPEFLGGRPTSGNQDRYVPCQWNKDASSVADDVQAIIKCNGVNGVPLRINMAGNGIYTFASHGISQEDVDRKALEVLLEIQKRGIPIRAIRSGGQSGADEAGAKAGIALGIPTEVHAPRGYRFRDAKNRDICDETLFKKRFGVDIQEEGMKEGAAKTSPVQSVRTIFTIGHSNQTLSEFITKLQASMIDTVISVRSIGRSSYSPQFNNENLMDALREYGIGFYDAGESLGGRQLQETVIEGRGYVNLRKIKESPIFDDAGRVDWAAVRKEERFIKALSSVTSMMEKGRMIALMCSEADPVECHRLGMIARDFSEKGYEVLNILRNGHVESMEETESRMIDAYVKRGLLPDEGIFEDRREQAYRIQNHLKGWRPEDMVRKKWAIKH